jgi:hypothetical protein
MKYYRLKGIAFLPFLKVLSACISVLNTLLGMCTIFLQLRSDGMQVCLLQTAKML